MPHPIVFTHPEPPPATTRIWPVFLPFAGCPYRCLYCAQDKQTGRDHVDLGNILRDLETDLEQALAAGRGPYEIAFYGGTFTALPEPWPETFLSMAARFRERGLITRVRCSTRPDCVDPDGLAGLRAQGLDMVELGVQSFDDAALRTSGRGYTGETARAACAMVKEAGLALGIQLLPGLPGDRDGVFADDVRRTAGLAPETVRLYPCLVIRDTPLAALWEQGEYAPWTLSRTRAELAGALLALWAKNVRVIRLGLPPEGTLAEHILDGPWHPALGQSVRGLALAQVIWEKIQLLGKGPSSLDVPRRYQGELLGHADELAEEYAILGFGKGMVRYVDGDEFVLE
ncbi:elongator complex protein 3 [Pseudodesulfovibrio portus]|uniref:Radical SAM protein n=1 Tax=Pseudodesulfovibrio portus TaxID=231439 RepID=A0ABM8ATG8_9BACT|nr:radical SAM protein [Pseudodesulfovibrio portus]BDQ34721.1 radical SAM protein [Pseudodesulfovibrio portus]